MTLLYDVRLDKKSRSFTWWLTRISKGTGLRLTVLTYLLEYTQMRFEEAEIA